MSNFVSSDEIRSQFSRAMSDMYRREVPQYGALLELVKEINGEVLAANPDLMRAMTRADEIDRLDVERHGAIRLGTADELATIRRLFAVMGMHPVGYYDLVGAGTPVHATAFRPIDDASLRRNPFRVFTSLLRLELIKDEALRERAEQLLARRSIFTPRTLALINLCERQGGLTRPEGEEFVREALETFRWHRQSPVDYQTYRALHDTHRLIADVVCFKGPHINHLTPRTLDIDAVQRRMPAWGISPKEIIEGPPRRHCAILLRQTSFKALEEPVDFVTAEGEASASTHTARFGEIEQRGIALTPEGRRRYDAMLAGFLASGPRHCDEALALAFAAFPDDAPTLRAQGLAYFRYEATAAGKAAPRAEVEGQSVDALIAAGYLSISPIIYEDFLPVSAAGIFQSNLGSAQRQSYDGASSRVAFESALGASVHDEFALYAESEAASRRKALAALGR